MPTLDGLTRREDEQTAGKAPYRLLEPVAELSSGAPQPGSSAPICGTMQPM